MGKILVIAEKPSVGRDIAKVLKCSIRKDGYLEGEKYIVTWAIGHLITLLEPEEYDEKYKKWRLQTLPIIPEKMKLKPVANTKKQFQIVKKLMNEKEVDSIICATDSGREGELIFRYIYEAAKCKKSFERLWISSMTDTAILEGFKKLKSGEEYNHLYESAKCRSEADWLVGMNASRAFTIQYNTLLSIGRVQTPTLAIIVNKQKEIEDFVITDYWEIQGFFENYKGTWVNLETKETKILEESNAKEILEVVKGQQGVVDSIEEEEKKQPSPLLYDLTELQRDANKKFGFSAQKTLSIAQDLYEKRKMITYPRTDSRYLSQDMIPKIRPTLEKVNIENLKSYAEVVLNLEEIPISKRIVDDTKVTDHHAIIPTEASPRLQSLSEEEYKIYVLIVKRFISVFYPYYIYKVTKILTKVKEHFFLSKGNMIIQLGWMEIYKEDMDKEKEKKKEEEQDLPKMEVGFVSKLMGAKLIKKKTQPPKPYTEASLLSAMENAGRFIEDEALKEQLKDSGLGTPATRAAIIERLIQVGYIQRKGKILSPTEKGIKLIEIIPEELKSPETTGKWERGLTLISKGKMQSDKFMQSIVRYVHYLIQKSYNKNTSVEFPEEKTRGKSKGKRKSFGSCILCDTGKVLEHQKGFYCSNWDKGCKFTIWKNSLERYGQTIDEKIVKQLMEKGIIEKVEMVLPQTNEKCIADLTLNKEKNGMLEFKNVTKINDSVSS